MKKLFSARLVPLLLASGAAAVVPEVPLVLLTGKDNTEYTLNEYHLNETTGRITVVIAGNYPPGGAKQKAIAMLSSKHRVPMARARKVDANLFCFRFSADGAKFQRVFDRYVDADGEVIADLPVNTKKWETAKPQLTSGKAYRLAVEQLSQLDSDGPTPPPPPAVQKKQNAPEPPAALKKQDVPEPRSNQKQPPAKKDAPRAAGPGRAVTADEWQKLSYAQLSSAVGTNTDVNEFIAYTAPDGAEAEGYVLAAVAARRDADAGRILNLLLDRGADPANDPSVLANYILTHGKNADMALVDRLAASKEQIDPAFLACCTAGATKAAEKLLDAGASVNDAEYNPDASVLLEALNVKAAPQIITMLVERGADTKREGEVYDAKSGESFRGTPAELAQARGYGENVIGLLR